MGFILSGLLLAGSSLSGDEPWSVLVVQGAEGAGEFGASFVRQAETWEALAKAGGHRFGWIGRESAMEPPDRERLRLALELGGKEAEGLLWLVLIGHGTFDGDTARFNLRGPDVSAAELSEWLAPYEKPVVVINASSASAPFLKALSSSQRVVMTATRSGYEQSYARFGDFLSQCFQDPEADLDKDQQVSLLEAFVVAGSRVEEFYRSEGRLASEHALLDDNGDGLGTPADWYRGVRVVRAANHETEPDGARAHQIHLLPSPAERALPATIRARRDALEMEVVRLRERKDTLEASAYYQTLEEVLLELARLYREAESMPRVGEEPVAEAPGP